MNEIKRIFFHLISYFLTKNQVVVPPITTGFSTFSLLPEEIMVEIFARLPVRDLLRCKRVCKLWYATITTPSFISKHLLNYHSSSNDNARNNAIKYCGLDKYAACISFISDQGVKLSRDIISPFFAAESCSNDVSFYGHCNGIICVLASRYGNGTSDNDEYIALWNPATREIKRIRDSNSLHHNDDAKAYWLTNGFGYDTTSNEYKVISIIEFRPRMNPGSSPSFDRVVEVYYSSTDSWKELKVELPKAIQFSYGCSAYLNGFYYWLASDDCSKFVLSFDFANEVFEKIPLPRINDLNGAATLVKFDETVALVANDSESWDNCLAVWLLDMNNNGEKKREWTKWYTFPCTCDVVIGFLRSGEALIVENDDNLGDILVGFDPIVDLRKHIRLFDQSYCGPYQILDYVESLVSFKGTYELHPTEL